MTHVRDASRGLGFFRTRGAVSIVASVFVAVAPCMSGDGWAAQQTHRSSRKAQPPSPARSAPDVTGTIPAAKPPAPKAPSVPATASKVEDDGPLPEPFNLPTASRARMRTCGLQWQDIKISGRAGDQTWREFATKCLSDSDGAGRSSP